MTADGQRSSRFADLPDVADVAAAIAATLTVTSQRWPSLPAEHATDRTGVRVLCTAEHDVWLLRWPKGSNVQPHDHGPSVGGFALVAGVLEEVRWRDGVRLSRTVRPGQPVTVERGVVHDVVGVSHGALSVHVYSPPLREMTFYDASGTIAVGRETVESGEMDAAASRVDAAPRLLFAPAT